MDNVRLAFVVALAFIALMMWEAWQKDYAQLETTTPMPEQTTVDAVPEIAAAPAPPSPRATAAPSPAVATPTSPELEVPRSAQDRKLATVTVVTDLFALTISTIGGGIDHAALLAYPIRIDTRRTDSATAVQLYPHVHISKADSKAQRIRRTNARRTTILCIRPRANITNWRKERIY